MKTRKKTSVYSPLWLWLWLLLSALTAGGCVNDYLNTKETKADKGEAPALPAEAAVPVTIRLLTRFGQGAAGAPTRGPDEAAEGRVDNVYVFFLRTSDSRVHSVVEGKDVTNATTIEKTFTANLEVAGSAGQEFRCIVLANAGGLLSGQNLNLYKEQTYEELQRTLAGQAYAAAPAPGAGDFAMWGEAEEKILATRRPQKITIHMLRALARVDIGLGINADRWDGRDAAGNDIPFLLRKIFIFKPQSRCALMPVAGAYDAVEKRVTLPSPAGEALDAPFEYDVPPGAVSLRGSIYLPEADVRQGADAESGDAHHTDRCAIVVQGSYRGHADTYYRIDFHNGARLADLLRNHRFQASITAVSGDGASTAEGAYNSRSVNLSATVVGWTDWSQDVIFDGVDEVYVSSKRILLPGNAGQTGYIGIESNVDPAEWRMSLNGAPLSADSSIGNADFEVTKPGSKAGSLQIKTLTRLPEGAGAKTATLGVKIHRLEFEISIRQNVDTPEEWMAGEEIPKEL